MRSQSFGPASTVRLIDPATLTRGELTALKRALYTPAPPVKAGSLAAKRFARALKRAGVVSFATPDTSRNKPKRSR